MDLAPSQDERRWILSLRNRDRDAWNQFVPHFRNLVQGVIRRTAAHWQTKLQESDVDDLAAEVFAAALRGLERFRAECTLSTWLTSITRHVVNRELGRAWHTKLVRLDASSDESPDAAPPPLENLLVVENRQRINAALRQLPKMLRHALRLHYLQRLGYREIGQRLGISINSVGPALARGRQLLRELLRKSADSAEMRTLNAVECKQELARSRRAASRREKAARESLPL